jgi:hypothetical protein
LAIFPSEVAELALVEDAAVDADWVEVVELAWDQVEVLVLHCYCNGLRPNVDWMSMGVVVVRLEYNDHLDEQIRSHSGLH